MPANAGQVERGGGVVAILKLSEIRLHGAAVDEEVAAAGHDAHTGDGRLAAASGQVQAHDGRGWEVGRLDFRDSGRHARRDGRRGVRGWRGACCGRGARRGGYGVLGDVAHDGAPAEAAP